jgi:hypothetical protein
MIKVRVGLMCEPNVPCQAESSKLTAWQARLQSSRHSQSQQEARKGHTISYCDVSGLTIVSE